MLLTNLGQKSSSVHLINVSVFLQCTTWESEGWVGESGG